jgi:hypothetical protein
MKAVSVLSTATLATILVFGDAVAADFDGSKPFLCASVDVSSCVPGQDCARETAQTVNAPAFFIVDVTKSLVTETGPGSNGRSSKIDRVEHRSGLLVLSGIDGQLGWNASIGESTGKLSYAVIRDREGIVVFGSCLVQR